MIRSTAACGSITSIPQGHPDRLTFPEKVVMVGRAMSLRSKIGEAVKELDRENGPVDVIERVAHLSAALGLLD